MAHLKKRLLSVKYTWKSLFAVGIFSAYLYIFMEWVFIVTRPSFLSAAGLSAKVKVLFFSEALLAALVLMPLALLALASYLLKFKFSRLLLTIGASIPAAVLSALALLMLDNFTYTIFHFGIISTQGISRALYLLLFLFLFWVIFLDLKKDLTAFEKFARRRRMYPVFLAAAFGFVAASLLILYEPPQAAAQDRIALQSRPGSLPHILLITADGLNAANTSLYGYERDTTPVLADLARRSLLAENAFNNSGKTLGSVVSIFTSKYPTETRTLHSPDILHGEDAYQHLPNILKSLGYYNIQYAQVYHVDAFTENMLSGFEEVNGKTALSSAYLDFLNRYLSTDCAYFIYEVATRIVDRLRHITFNKSMPDRRDLVIDGEGQQFDDQAKVDRILAVIQSSDRPVFAHLHWMGTHGGHFFPTHRVFSQEKDMDQQVNWDRDFYDDSILDFDAAVRQIIAALKAMGVYENTIIVVGTDHSQKYLTNQRIPLLIHFPGDQYARRVSANVQNMDIAPTLLEYLQVPQPAWMRGTSFLKSNPGARPIFGVGVTGVNKTVLAEAGYEVDENDLPPFYAFGYISVIYCDTWYELDLDSYHWRNGVVDGHTDSCTYAPPVSDEAVLAWMRDRLAADEFDVSSLSAFSPIVQTGP